MRYNGYCPMQTFLNVRMESVFFQNMDKISWSLCDLGFQQSFRGPSYRQQCRWPIMSARRCHCPIRRWVTMRRHIGLSRRFDFLSRQAMASLHGLVLCRSGQPHSARWNLCPGSARTTGSHRCKLACLFTLPTRQWKCTNAKRHRYR